MVYKLKKLILRKSDPSIKNWSPKNVIDEIVEQDFLISCTLKKFTFNLDLKFDFILFSKP